MAAAIRCIEQRLVGARYAAIATDSGDGIPINGRGRLYLLYLYERAPAIILASSRGACTSIYALNLARAALFE